MPGSSARFRNRAVWPSAPLDSMASRNCSAVSCGTPIPAKTTAKLSLPWSPRSRARWAISAASRSCGKPPAENSGSFCPRTRLFITSMVAMPVSMKSRGRARQAGLMASPSIRLRASAGTGGPPSSGRPTLSKTRPSRCGPTPNSKGSGCNRMRVPCRLRPAVDSSTSITIESSSSAATRPRRGGPLAASTSTAEFRPTRASRRAKSSGPSMRVTTSFSSRSARMAGHRLQLVELVVDLPR